MVDLLSKANKAPACMGWIGNAVSHNMLSIFVLMAKELRRMMSTHVQACHQICLSSFVIGVQEETLQCSGGAGVAVLVGCSKGTRSTKSSSLGPALCAGMSTCASL